MAVAADQVFVEVPARGVERALLRRPFVERVRVRPLTVTFSVSGKVTW